LVPPLNPWPEHLLGFISGMMLWPGTQRDNFQLRTLDGLRQWIAADSELRLLYRQVAKNEGAHRLRQNASNE